MDKSQKLQKRLVPLDIVFSSERITDSDSKYHAELSKWQDVPIANLEPFFSAFRAVSGENDSLDQFLDFERKRIHPREFDPESVVANLRQELSVLKRLLRRKYPVIAKLDRDRLVLERGNLHCAIAKYRGKSWIPVLMPPQVANRWDARPTTEIDAVAATQGETFYTPTLHSRYRHAKTSRSGGKRLDLMRRFLGPTHRRLSVLDIGCNNGFNSFHLWRQGFDVLGIDFADTHLAVAHALRSLYSAEVEIKHCALQDFEPGRKYDIVLGLTVFYHMLGWAKMAAVMSPDQLARKLESLVGHALFWESGDMPSDEIELITSHTNLSHYTKLGITFATGKTREFGVFTRQPTEAALRVLRD